MIPIDTLYFSEAPVKVQLAYRLLAALSPLIDTRPAIGGSLSRLVTKAASLREQMGEMGLFKVCGECGRQPAGGCCSAYMAQECDAVLLLMNLLAGQDVAPVRDDGFECCFLGSSGCILAFKPIFCLNYNCRRILSGSAPPLLRKLERATAHLLQEQVHLEQLLHELLLANPSLLPGLTPK